ncbi:MAG: alpha/beta fold hydrolase, partial [Propionibacteriaceae bacterium]|nr:alpha/beta fold hydrolase [Propionibacteriaceae bacterium]
MRTTTENLPGLTLTNLTVEAPLDHADPAAGTIEVFARVVTGDGGAGKPYLVFLQGGPGHEAARPTLVPTNPSWLQRALVDFQVVLLDQRGTGRSTPISSSLVKTDGRAGARLAAPLAGLDTKAQAAFLTHLRADEIVNDCELVRTALGAPTWTVLGQSFGGFTTLHYLSVHPESLAGALVTGGLSAVRRPIDDVYA